MGNDQSRGNSGQAQIPEKSLNYYELLQIDEEADFDDIKRSYRKLALVNHPDKNPHRVAEATKLFADLQQAYEVLSDPNERAFYDKNLHTAAPPTDDDLYDHVRTGAETDPKSKLNRRRKGDPGVSLEQLMRFFDPSMTKKMDDTTEGFFSVYRTLFALLAADELLHTDMPLEYPTFGASTDEYAPPVGLTRAQKDAQVWARDFYTVWSEFSTEKKFEWVAKWDLSKGDDRQIRRLMERENKKIRDDYKRDYNEAVRQLALFLQHRDPRYKQHQAKLRAARVSSKKATSSTTSASPPAKSVQTEKQKEDARLRAAEEYEEQAWQRLHLDPSSGESDEEEAEEEGDGTGVRLNDGQGGEIFECVACDKTFLSEASWENHERSKKHKQAVWRLKKEMQMDDGAFDPEADLVSGATTPGGVEELQDSDDSLAADLIAELDDLDLDVGSASRTKKKRKGKGLTPSVPVGDTTEADHAPSEDLPRETSQPITPADDDDAPSEISKRDKRRAKEAKKKAAEEAEHLARKEARKASKKTQAPHDTLLEQNDRLRKDDGKSRNDEDFTTPRTKKGKGKQTRSQQLPDEFSDEKVGKSVRAINTHREKILDKWGEQWDDMLHTIRRLYALDDTNGASSSIPELQILCLGLGKPFSDRSAQIQLALLLELSARLQSSIHMSAYDPVSDKGDCKVLEQFGITLIEENMMGRHKLDSAVPYLLYMPHCSRVLYESILHTNFEPSLGRQPVRLILGNDLAEYIGFVREEIVGQSSSQALDEEFTKPKKKRKGKIGAPQPKDGVLERLVPHMSALQLSILPETNLPGFARAFLSLCFMWLPADTISAVDWQTPLPEIVWPEDGELIGKR